MAPSGPSLSAPSSKDSGAPWLDLLRTVSGSLSAPTGAINNENVSSTQPSCFGLARHEYLSDACVADNGPEDGASQGLWSMPGLSNDGAALTMEEELARCRRRDVTAVKQEQRPQWRQQQQQQQQQQQARLSRYEGDLPDLCLPPLAEPYITPQLPKTSAVAARNAQQRLQTFQGALSGASTAAFVPSRLSVPCIDEGRAVASEMQNASSHSLPGEVYRPTGGARMLAISRSCPGELQACGAWTLDDFTFVKTLRTSPTCHVNHAVLREKGLRVVLKAYIIAELSAYAMHRVRREVAIHSQLHHPNIIECYGAFEDAGQVVLVLEYAAKGDLFDYVASTSDEPIDEQHLVRRLVVPILSGLEYLHSKNVIHRDIKLENLLITADDTVKLADFGLSIDASVEHPVLCLGTLDYMSPEVLRCPSILDQQASSGMEVSKRLPAPPYAYDHKVDCWACGVLVYELLTRTRPFVQPTQESTVLAIQYGHPQLPATLSLDCHNFIARCLSKAAALRPTVQELLKHSWIRSNLPSSAYRLFSDQGEVAHSLPAAATFLQQLRIPTPDSFTSCSASGSVDAAPLTHASAGASAWLPCCGAAPTVSVAAADSGHEAPLAKFVCRSSQLQSSQLHTSQLQPAENTNALPSQGCTGSVSKPGLLPPFAACSSNGSQMLHFKQQSNPLPSQASLAVIPALHTPKAHPSCRAAAVLRRRHSSPQMEAGNGNDRARAQGPLSLLVPRHMTGSASRSMPSQSLAWSAEQHATAGRQNPLAASLPHPGSLAALAFDARPLHRLAFERPPAHPGPRLGLPAVTSYTEPATHSTADSIASMRVRANSGLSGANPPGATRGAALPNLPGRPPLAPRTELGAPAPQSVAPVQRPRSAQGQSSAQKRLLTEDGCSRRPWSRWDPQAQKARKLS